MQTFQEFLASRIQRVNLAERRARRDEWLSAVARLMEQIEGWLAESDPQRVLDVIPIQLESTEPSLGRYRVNGLRIALGEEAVQVKPVGRDTVGGVALSGHGELPSQGRVDITDGVRRWMLYRTAQDGNERWYALDDRFQATPLDRPRLEAILQDLLS